MSTALHMGMYVWHLYTRYYRKMDDQPVLVETPQHLANPLNIWNAGLSSKFSIQTIYEY